MRVGDVTPLTPHRLERKGRHRGWPQRGGENPAAGQPRKPASITRWFHLACYTKKIVIRGFFWTLLVAMGLWGSFPVSHLVKGAPASCQSACTCGCCMHGGMCPMVAAKASMEHGSTRASGANRSQSGVSCSCSVSHSTVPLMQSSHADMCFNLPHAGLSFELPLSIRRAGSSFVFLPAVDGLLPDPPPKTFSSV